MDATGRRFLFIGFVIFLLGAAVAYQQARVSAGQEAVTLSIPGISAPRVQEQPVLERYYRACGHREPLPLPAGVQWRWGDEENLALLFPPEEGWRLIREGERLVISQEVDGLCPVDAPKRHLAVKDGLVAVYQGPAGSLGPLLKVTSLPFAALPPHWQEKITGNKAEFNSEQELLQAMDSLDEFRPPQQ